ncbi:hypothetical protein ACFE04_031836 [Oxalis oulophora]
MAIKLKIFLSFATLFLINSVCADWNILKRKNDHSDLSLDASLKSYCESWRINVEVHNIREFEVVPQECVDYIKKYMTSSQYKVDSEMVIYEIKLYLGNCCCFKPSDKDSWIFDIDDTLLSTIPYYKKHGFGGDKLNSTSLELWMNESKAPALEHTLKLFNDIKERGLKIFLVSSRRESLRSSTVDNLIQEGYHGWTSLTLRDTEEELMLAKDYKSNVRKRLVDQGYKIWGIIGDQWSSLNGYPHAKRTFKLPNSMYYLS